MNNNKSSKKPPLAPDYSSKYIHDNNNNNILYMNNNNSTTPPYTPYHNNNNNNNNNNNISTPFTPYTPYSDISSPDNNINNNNYVSGSPVRPRAETINSQRRKSSIITENIEKNLKLVTILVIILTIGLLCGIIICRLHFDAPPAKGNSIDKTNPTGWLAVIGAIIIFGSYGILIKAPQIQNAGVDTLVFQVYYSSGVALTSLLVLAYTPFIFSWWGVIGAGIWVASQLFAYVAIYGLGYAVALSLWAALTMVVSFLWGAIAFNQHVSSYIGCGLALTCLTTGIVGVAACETDIPDKIRQWINGKDIKTHRSSFSDHHHQQHIGYGLMDTPMTDTDYSDSEFGDIHLQQEIPHIPRSVGLLCAIMVGLLNGSLMVPFHYFQQYDLPKDTDVIAYLTSLALGIFMVTPVCFACYCIHHWHYGIPVNVHFRVACIPGLITGFFWSAGNAASVYATSYLGDTLGFPLTQTAICIAGLWGILYYREIRGKYAIGLFTLSLFIIVGGAVLLAKFAT